MDKNLLPPIVLLILGLFLLIPGLIGFLTGKLTMSSKGRIMTYTGPKAVVIGLGFVISGMINMIAGVIVALKPALFNSKQLPWLFVISLGIVAVFWIISLFVSGQSVSERRRWLD